MKLMYRYTLLLIFFVFLGSEFALAQCTQTLNEAEDEYDKGRLLDIPNKLSFCLRDNQFSKEETIRAYKLLTLVYIFSDQEQKAEEALVKLLKADPEHELQEQFDPAEIFYLYDKFKVDPIFRISLRAGANYSQVNAFDNFNVFSADRVSRTYTNQFGFSGEVTIERHLGKGLEVNGGVQLGVTSFNVVDELEGGPFTTEINESQTVVKVPIFARYNVNYNAKKGIIPYVIAGGAFNYLVNARLVDSQRQGGTSRSVNNVSLLDQDERNQVNVSVFGGIGAKFRSKRVHFFSIEARYEVGLFNYVNPENRFLSSLSAIGLTYVPDNLSLNYVSILFGYTRSIYNPKKKKEYL